MISKLARQTGRFALLLILSIPLQAAPIIFQFQTIYQQASVPTVSLTPQSVPLQQSNTIVVDGMETFPWPTNGLAVDTWGNTNFWGWTNNGVNAQLILPLSAGGYTVQVQHFPRSYGLAVPNSTNTFYASDLSSNTIILQPAPIWFATTNILALIATNADTNGAAKAIGTTTAVNFTNANNTFTGSGTGLTGTAAALSVGSAATAANATTVTGPQAAIISNAVTNNLPAKTNDLWICPAGNDATGQRGILSQIYPFQHLSTAVQAMTNGDCLHIADGIYPVDTNNCGILPKNVSLTAGGYNVLNFSLTNDPIPGSAGPSNVSCYLQPSDNSLIRGLSFHCVTTNYFAYAFGTTKSTPGATNWTLDNCSANGGDSDVIYFNSTNNVTGWTISGFRAFYPNKWDTFACYGTNISGTIVSSDFSVDGNYQVANALRPVNINSGGPFVFKNCIFRGHITRMGYTGTGVLISGPYGQISLENCLLDMGNNYIDLDIATSIMPLSISGVSELNTNFIKWGQYISTSTTGIAFLNAPTAGATTVNTFSIQMGNSYSPNAQGYADGEWDFFDDGQFSLIISNRSAIEPAPCYIKITDNDSASGDTANGYFSLYNAIYAGNGNGITNLATSYWTNIVSGKIYTNNSQQVLSLDIPVMATAPATTAGSSEIDADIHYPGSGFVTEDDVGISGSALTFPAPATNRLTLHFKVPSGCGWTITNSISGTGFAGLINNSAGKTNTATFY